MLFENREEMKEFAKILAKKMLEKRPLSEWRKWAKERAELSCGNSYYPGKRCLSPLPLGTYTKALNKMHSAVNGIRPYAEDRHRGNDQAMGETEEKSQVGQTDLPHAWPCAQVCLPLPEYNCGEEGFICEGQVRFTCGVFTCTPGSMTRHECLANEFVCRLSFKCSSFDDTDGDCYLFDCTEPSPYDRCPQIPYQW